MTPLEKNAAPLDANAKTDELIVRLPQPGRLVVKYEIDGAPAEAKLLLQLRTSAILGWEGVENIREPIVPNQGEIALNDLPPGEYELWRPKRDEHGGHGTFLCDHRTVKIESGETSTSDFVRDRGTPILGSLVGKGLLSLESTVVMVRPAAATGDPESNDDWKLPVFDAIVCGAQSGGEFKTERLAPGEYALVAHGYLPETPEERTHTGVRSPRYVGRTVVTVTQDGPPPDVEIWLRDRGLREPDPRTAWGGAKQGLKVGLTYADRTDKRYAAGEVVPLELVVQNVSDEPIFCTYAVWPHFSDNPLQVLDDDDKDHGPPKTSILQSTRCNTRRIEPGAIVLLAQRNVEFRADPEEPKDRLRYWAIGGAGKYRISQEVAISTKRTQVGEAHELDTDLDTVTTGPLELELAEAQARQPETRGRPHEKTRLRLRASSVEELHVKTRKFEQPGGGIEFLTEVEGGTELAIERTSDVRVEIAADRILVELGADIEFELDGDQLQADLPPNVPAKIVGKGNVQVTHGETSLSADQIELDAARRRLQASGKVRIQKGSRRIEAERAGFDLTDDQLNVQGTGVIQDIAADKLPAATWGEVHAGWQMGLRWKSGRVEHEVGEQARYEVVVRNTSQDVVTVPVTKGELRRKGLGGFLGHCIILSAAESKRLLVSLVSRIIQFNASLLTSSLTPPPPHLTERAGVEGLRHNHAAPDFGFRGGGRACHGRRSFLAVFCAHRSANLPLAPPDPWTLAIEPGFP